MLDVVQLAVKLWMRGDCMGSLYGGFWKGNIVFEIMSLKYSISVTGLARFAASETRA